MERAPENKDRRETAGDKAGWVGKFQKEEEVMSRITDPKMSS